MSNRSRSCLADESPPTFNTTPSIQYISDISQPSLVDMPDSFFLNNTSNSSCPSSTQNNSWDNSTMTPDAFNQFHSAMPSWVDVWTPQPRPRPRPLMGRASPQYSLPAEAPWSPQRQCPFTPNLNASMQQADLFAEDLDGSVPDNFNQMHSAIPPWVDVWTPPRPRPETLYDDRNRGYPPSPSSPSSGPCSPFGGRAPPNSPAPEVPVRGPPTRPPSRNIPCPPIGDPNQSPLGNFTEDSEDSEFYTPHATGRQFMPCTPPRSTPCPTPAYRPRSINMDDVSSESTIDISSEPESSLHMRPYRSLSVIEEDLSGERPSGGSPPYHSTPRRQSVCPRPSFVTRSINMDDVSSEPESSLHMRPYESLSVIQEDDSGERPSVYRPPPRTTPRRPTACPRPAPSTCPTSLDFNPYVPYSTPPRAERSVDESLPDPFNYMMSSMPSMLDVWTPQPRPPAVNLLAGIDDLPTNLRMPLRAIEHAKRIQDMRNAEYEAEVPNRFSGRRSCPGRPQINQALQNMNPRPNPLYNTCMNIGNERVDDVSMISMHSPGPEHLSDVSAPNLCNISTSFVPQGPQVATGRLLDLSSPRPVQRPHPVLGLPNLSAESAPELCNMSIGTPLPPRTPYPAARDSSRMTQSPRIAPGAMNESMLEDSYKSILERFNDVRGRGQGAPQQGPSGSCERREVTPGGVTGAVRTTSTQIDGRGGCVTETIVERSAVENGELRTRTTHTISREDPTGHVSSESLEAMEPTSQPSSHRSRMSAATCATPPAQPGSNRSRMSAASRMTPPADARRRLDFANMSNMSNLADMSMPSFAASPESSPISSTRMQNLTCSQLSDESMPSIPSPNLSDRRWDNTSALRRAQSLTRNATPSGFMDPSLPFSYAAPPRPAQFTDRRSQSLSRPSPCPSQKSAFGRSQSLPRSPSRAQGSPPFGHMESSMPFANVPTTSPCDVVTRYKTLRNRINEGGTCPSNQIALRPGSPSRTPSQQNTLIDVSTHSPFTGGPPQPPCDTLIDVSDTINDSDDPFSYTGNYPYDHNDYGNGPYAETTINVEIKASKRSVRRGNFSKDDEAAADFDSTMDSCD